jgi:hypothetical protein
MLPLALRIALAAPPLLLAAPAAAQTSGCARDASGSLVCSVAPSPALPNSARRITPTRDLAAAAQARSLAQAQALRDAADHQRQAADKRAGLRPSPTCSGSGRRPGSAASPSCR